MPDNISKTIRDKISLKYPERADRELLIEWVLSNDEKI